MKLEQEVCFDRYRLDSRNARLWRGTEAVPLTPKAFAVLSHLARQAGRLVTKEELLQAVWADTLVSDAALVVCIGEVRKALEDRPREPRFIETVHRRGYRFIARPSPAECDGGGEAEAGPAVDLVGRSDKLAQLAGCLDKGLRGERQVVLVAGETGSGKTALVKAFLHGADGREVWTAKGECFKRFGPVEPFLPVLEACSQLCRSARGQPLVDLLRTHAPSWLAQMPWLQGDQEAPGQPAAGATADRMLREITEVFETLTARVPLLLVFEDLHWGDNATLDLVSALARRRQPAKLMVLGTYRPADVISSGHPLQALKQELETRRLCVELSLEALGVGDVAEYLRGRFPGSAIPAELAQQAHRWTGGLPLFVVNLIDDLLEREVLRHRGGRLELAGDAEALERGVPESIRAMTERQVDQLTPDERRVLEGASVVGVEFSAAAVAAGLQADVLAIEDCCEALARRQQFLERQGSSEWPDGTVAARYRFRYRQYQDVFYLRLTAARRLHLHQRVGERLEAAYGEGGGDIGGELARSSA
jgi:predicted ATPase/DNA-binding winged helix-turn-helix (wHTH) protein